MRRLFLTLLSLFCILGLSAQGVKDVRINEILVKNVDNYVDDYGHRSSWIELFNDGHSRVDIGGCVLKVTLTNGQEIQYSIPTGDPNTSMAPMDYRVFFCEGTGTKGTFYTNFTLDNVKTIELLNSSGKGKPIDAVDIDYSAQMPDVSIGRFTTEDHGVIFTTLPQTTPNATNDTEPLMPRSEKFRLMDPTGAILAITAILIVLTVLISLFLLFKILGNYMIGMTRKRVAASKKKNNPDAETETSSPENPYEIPYTGDEVAAIVMALHMYHEDLHDKESAVLTINKVARSYSPWSSKIYGLNQYPNKKR